MAKSIETAKDGLWYLKYVESENAYFVKINDERCKTKSGDLTEKVENVKPCKFTKGYQGLVLITFNVPMAAGGRAKVRFDLAKLDSKNCSNGDRLVPHVASSEAFCSEVKKLLEKQLQDQPLATSSPNTSSSTKKRKKCIMSASTMTKTDDVDLPSPSKRVKIPATDIDQRIDSHYLGHLHLKVDTLSDSCPESWLDRPVDEAHVTELANALERSPTLAKSMQSWIAIADISSESVTSKDLLKGCRMTVIGGRHRQVAYKKVKDISDAHRKELEKVWVHIYDNQLNEGEVRRLAAIHNVGNVGSMTTPWMTRVRACREWLYKAAGANILEDDTSPSTQAWKVECQSMYVPKDKDPNTLEPTLQAALLRRDVYQEFRKVGEMFSKGEVKDQNATKRKQCYQIPQSKLGMPLQGLKDETKIEVLRQVTRRELSLKELKQKCQRIKKKQLVVNAFLKHTGETSYHELHKRFPLHANEESWRSFLPRK